MLDYNPNPNADTCKIAPASRLHSIPTLSNTTTLTGKQLSEQIHAQGTNIGFVLGKCLGKILGTSSPKPPAIPLPPSAYDEKSRLSAKVWEICKKAIGFSFYWVDKLIRPKKVMQFLPMHDHNEAFDERQIIRAYQSLPLLRDGYQRTQWRIQETPEICKYLEPYQKEKVDMIIFSAHGSTKRLQFSQKYPQGYLEANKLKETLSCLPNVLKTNGKVIFESCLTGNLAGIPLDIEAVYGDVKYTFFQKPYYYYWSKWMSHSDNLAYTMFQFLQKSLPNVEVIAPYDNMVMMDIQRLNPLEVKLYTRMKESHFVDVAVRYNQQTVELIEKLRTLLEVRPTPGLMSVLLNTPYLTPEREHWHQVFSETHQALAKAMLPSKDSRENKGIIEDQYCQKAYDYILSESAKNIAKEISKH